MDKDKSLGSLEEVEAMIGMDTILKMDLDQLMEMVGYYDQEAEERSSHTEDSISMDDSDDTSTSVMEEGSSHTGNVDNVNIDTMTSDDNSDDPLNLDNKQSNEDEMSVWSILEEISAGASSKTFPNMTNMPNTMTITEFNFPSSANDDDENVETLIVNNASDNNIVPINVSEEMQGDIEVEASQITKNVSAPEDPLVGVNKCSLSVQIGEDVITISGVNAELVTAAKIVLNQFFNVSSADAEVPDKEPTIIKEEQTVIAKNDSGNADLVDVLKMNISSENENGEADEEDLKFISIKNQFLNVQSADAEIAEEKPTVETEIVKNDSDNEDLVDVQKNDVSGKELKEEEEQEQEDNSNLKSIENTHIVGKNLKEEKFTCPVCEKEFKHPAYYRAHFKAHKYGKQFKCEKCDNTFTMRGQLHKHEKFKCKYSGTKVACPECGKEFRDPSTLRYHMVLHEQPERVGTHNMRYSDEIKQEALELLKKYSKAETARKLKVTYSAITNWATKSKKSFKCSRCGKKLSEKAKLKKHERYACKGVKYVDKNKNGDGNFACSQCNLQTTLLSNLKEHIKSKHGGEKYACDQCDQIFNLKGSLRQHRIYRHIGIKHPCPECDIKTSTKSGLKKHIRKHHTTFPCTECEHTFTRNYSLQRHKQSVHKG